MENKADQSLNEVIKAISKDRERTNILKKYEQKAIAFLVRYIPDWVSSDMLTAIGFSGSVIVFAGFVLAAYVNDNWLLLGVPGFMVSWFGDSLDGRIAYYRKKPHKWYGFTLDLVVDWLGIILIGLGYILYADSISKLLGYLFVVLYGWEIIITLVRYRITDQYSIDTGILGPTEARIIISAILILEVIFRGSMVYISAFLCIVLVITNIRDFHLLLGTADERDKKESLSRNQ